MALNEHKNLDGDNLHVSKGFTAASENTFQTKDERGATYWQANNYLPSCLAIAVSTSAPPTETDGAIYILSSAGAPHANWDACLQTQWVRYRSSDGIWEGVTPSEGYLCYDKDTNALLRFDGAAWGSSSTSPSIGGTLTSATTGSVLFAGSGIFAQDNANFFYDDTNNRLGLGINASLFSRLHIKGEGATSATSAILIEDSAGVDFFKFLDDGTFFLGKAATAYDSDSVTIGKNSITNGTYSTALGTSSNTGSGIVKGTVVGYGATNSGNGGTVTGYNAIGTSFKPTTYGFEATAGSEGTSIGASAISTAAGTAIGSTASATGSENFAGGYGAIVSGYRGVGIGGYVSVTGSAGIAFGDRSWATATNAIAIGTIARNSIANSFLIGWETGAGARQSFFVNQNSNLVLSTMVALVAGTDFNTTFTNGLTIRSGTQPSAAITDSAQMGANSSGQLYYMDDSANIITL